MNRTNYRGWMMLFVALGVGLAAAKGARVWIRERVASEVVAKAQDAKPKKEIVVVTRDLPALTRIGPDDIQVLRLPAEAVPPTAVLETETAVGRMSRVRLFAGETLLEPKLAPRGGTGSLQGVIPEGYRAMTLKVDEVSGVAGFLVPGAKVDVVAVLKSQRGEPPSSKLILQDAEVAAVDQSLTAEGMKIAPASVVTLFVRPGDAERIGLATVEGKLILTMRAYGDVGSVETPGTDTQKLLERAPAAAAPIEVKKPTKLVDNVDVIENDRRTRVEFTKPVPAATESSTATVR